MTGEASPYIGDVLDAAFSAAQAIVVLETPDDIAYLHPSLTYVGDPETEAQPQPRPNVLFEAGMAMGRNPKRTVIVELGQVKVFSDIHGRHVVRLDDSVRKRQDLAQRLRTAGCAVDLNGTDWHESGDLTPPPPPGGGLTLGRKAPSTKARGTPRLAAKSAMRIVQEELADAFRGNEFITFQPGSGSDIPDFPASLTEPDDMSIVISPCHDYEPVKVPESNPGPFYCLICGGAFAV